MLKNNKMLGLIILICAIVLAVATYLYNRNSENEDTERHKELVNKSDSIKEGVENAKDNVLKSHDSIVGKIDGVTKQIKSMEDKKGGDTYNITSNNQTGGVTTGKVEITNITTSEDTINIFDHPENLVHQTDLVKKEIRFWFKGGKWKNPTIAYPLSEQSKVNGQWGCSTNVFMGNTAEGEIDIGTERYSFFETVQPITEDNHFIFKFDSPPSILRLGQNRIFKYSLRINQR